MSIITFPKNEWNDVQMRLQDGKTVWTVRVDYEYGKYKVGDILKTEWGTEIEILSVSKITGGIEELNKKYAFFSDLASDMVAELNAYDEMEIISLKKHVDTQSHKK